MTLGGRKFPHVYWRIMCVFVNLSVNCLHSFVEKIKSNTMKSLRMKSDTYTNILKKFQGHCFVHFLHCHRVERQRPPSAVKSLTRWGVDKTRRWRWRGVGVSLASCSDAIQTIHSGQATSQQHRSLFYLCYISSGNEARREPDTQH